MIRSGFLKRVPGGSDIVRFLPVILFQTSFISAQTPPNILLIMADDWGYGDVAVYGKGMPSPLAPSGVQEHLLTPNLDQMAAEGMRYTQFYINSAVCSPARASVMTGQFTRRHGIGYHYEGIGFADGRGMPHWLPVDGPVLTKILKEAGYATAHFGKWHLTSWDAVTAPTPVDYGIDEHMLTVGGGNGQHRLPTDTPGWNPFPGVLGSNAERETWRAQASEEIVDSTISFIERHSAGPFFVNVWIFDTHGRLYTTDDQKSPYASLSDELQVYYGAVTDSDFHLGRLMDKLVELGLDSNTLVLFCSDNGPEVKDIDAMSGAGSTAGLRGMKRSGYEGGIRSPFIVRWPGHVPAGGVDSTTVMSGADLLPTLVSLAGGTVPAASEIDGLDMNGALTGTPLARTRPLLWHMGENVHDRADGYWTNPKVIIRDGPWKMFQNPDGSGVELYNIFDDPFEENDIVTEHAEVVTALKALLDTWMNGNTNIQSRTTDVPASVYEWPVGPAAAKAREHYQVRVPFYRQGLLTLKVATSGQHRLRLYDVQGNEVLNIILNGTTVYRIETKLNSGIYTGLLNRGINPAAKFFFRLTVLQ